MKYEMSGDQMLPDRFLKYFRAQAGDSVSSQPLTMTLGNTRPTTVQVRRS
ncbi:MAG: hypothetical protein QM820_10535 [Minicystis sp.]